MSPKEKRAAKAESEAGAELEKDWSDNTAEKIVSAVDNLKTRISSPFKPLAKFLAYLPLIILAIGGILVLISIGIFRIIDVYLPQDTWVAHFVLGGIYAIVGIIIWFKRPQFPN